MSNQAIEGDRYQFITNNNKRRAKVNSLRVKDLTDNTVFLISEKEPYVIKDLQKYIQYKNSTILKKAMLCYIYEDNELRKVMDDEHLAYNVIPISKCDGRLPKGEIAKEYKLALAMIESGAEAEKEREKGKEGEKGKEKRRLYIELDIDNYRNDIKTHRHDKLEARIYLVNDPIPLVELKPLVFETLRIYDITTLDPRINVSKSRWERKSAIEKWGYHIEITPDAHIKSLNGFDNRFTEFIIIQTDVDIILEIASYNNATCKHELKAGWYLLRQTEQVK